MNTEKIAYGDKKGRDKRGRTFFVIFQNQNFIHKTTRGAFAPLTFISILFIETAVRQRDGSVVLLNSSNKSFTKDNKTVCYVFVTS